MTDGAPLILTVVNAIGSALVAGVFFAFSAFVMAGLGWAPAEAGTAAMQGINLTAPTAPFMIAFLGTGATSVVLAVMAVVRWSESPAPWLLLGCVLYLATLVVTFVYHVPRNNALALLEPTAPSTHEAWDRYRMAWTGWNHVRTTTALGAAITFTLSLRMR